ncbi:MAG: amidohydrolase [Phycisphaerales bacterium]|nr:amidohydrolase [Phycisphaerales bacterium]
MPEFKAAIDAIVPELIDFRHDLHAHPETAFCEERTSGKVLAALKTIPGLDIQNNLAGGTGIAATLNADKPGPCVLLRADMDALPIHELSDLPYRSTIDGKMHACGHDGHTTCLLGTARVLAQFADRLPGKVKFCFQPAEEDGAGGERMIEDGVLENPHVDAAFAFHGWPEIPVGRIISVPGAILAAAAPFEIEFTGKGGHAAYPHRTADILLAAAQFVTNLQAIRSRFIDPLDPVVISVCAVHAGHATNVIPETCQLKGTIRALSEQAHTTAKQLVQRFLMNTATSFDVRADLRFASDYPVLINDEACAELVADVGRQLLGADKVKTKYPPSMGGEDFAFFARHVPSAMFRVGLQPAGAFEYPGLHNPRFNFNDDAIPTAIQMFCGIAQRYLSTHGDASGAYEI